MSKRFPRHASALAGLFVVLLVVGVMVYFVLDMLNSKPTNPKKLVQQITVIQPPPPPPPIEKPPEPEIKEEVEVPEPEEAPPEDVADDSDEPPPLGEDLGLDAEGLAGGDAFGLVGKKGGQSLIGGGGSRFRWYFGIVQSQINDALSEHEDLRKDRYSVVVQLWLDRDGSIDRVKLIRASGVPALDRKLERALSGITRLSEAPPSDMPQPIKVRISSRL